MKEKNATYKFSFVFSVKFSAEIKAIKAVLYLGYFLLLAAPWESQVLLFCVYQQTKASPFCLLLRKNNKRGIKP